MSESDAEVTGTPHIGLPPGSVGGIAYDALMMAQKADGKADSVAQAQESHEEVCAERYKNIHEKLGMIFKIIAWAGGSAFLVIMGLLGFLAKTQFDTISEMSKATAQRTEQMERAQAQPPQVVIQSQPGSPQITGATVDRKPTP